MEHAAVKNYVKIPKQEYNLLKEVYAPSSGRHFS